MKREGGGRERRKKERKRGKEGKAASDAGLRISDESVPRCLEA